jgi:hypothetical protein
MKWGISCIVIAAATLAGCQGVKYAMDNYKGVDIQHFVVMPADGQRFVKSTTGGPDVDRATTWRIFDKPPENRLMITPSLSAAMAGGAASGLTFGAAEGVDGPAVFRDAAQRYLDSTGRTCTTTTVDLIMKPQYEVRYECQVAGTVPSAPAPAHLGKRNAL